MAAANGLTRAASERLRVLFILDNFPDPHAGTESQFWLLFQSLDRSQFEPSILLLQPSAFLQQHVPPESVEVLNVTRLRSASSLFRILRSALKARASRIDVAHLYFNDVTLVYPPLLSLLGIPVIISRRDLGFWYTPRVLQVLRFNRRFVSAVVANCEQVSHAVAAAEGFASSVMRVIYNGLARQLPDAPRDVARELGLPADTQFVAVVANLRPLKRIEDAVRAISIVANAHSRAHLLVVGEDRAGVSGSHQAELTALAAQLGCGDRVHFLGKMADPMPVVMASDVCVLCSETEGLSNTVIEYMFAGKPAVCTAVGGNVELVVEGVTGNLVPVRNPEQLARALLALLRDRRLAQSFGAAARERALTLFSAQKMTASHENLYRGLIARPAM